MALLSPACAVVARALLVFATLCSSTRAWCAPRHDFGQARIASSFVSPDGRKPASEDVRTASVAARHRDFDDGVVGVSGRRRLFALLPLIVASHMPPSPASAKCRPSEALIDAREQLDLAVQASQAWDDAAEIANDPLLDEDNLIKAFGGSCDSLSRDQARATVVESVRKMRDLLTKKGKTAEDAMTFMKFGTSARTAADAYFLELDGER